MIQMVNNILITKPSPKPSFQSLSFLRLWTLEAQILWTVLREQKTEISKGILFEKWNMHLAKWLCFIVSNGLNKMERSLSSGGDSWSGPPLSRPLLSWLCCPGPGKACDCCLCLSFFLPSFFPSWKRKIQKNRKINERLILVYSPRIN